MNKRIRKKKRVGEFRYVPHYTPEQLVANTLAYLKVMNWVEEIGIEEFVKRLKKAA